MFFRGFLAAIILLIFTFGFSFAEPIESYNGLIADSLSINSFYKIKAKDGSGCEGILTEQASDYLLIKEKQGKELKVLRSQIQLIMDSVNKVIYLAKETTEEDEYIAIEGYKSQKDTTQKCNILLANNVLLKDVMIIDANDSSFKVLKSDFTHVYNITDIYSIKFINHGFGKGLMYGELASVIFFGAVGLIAIRGDGYPEYLGKGMGFAIGFIVGIPIGLISGMICEFTAKDDEYDFSKLNPDVKAKRLKYLIHKYKD